MFSKLKSSIYGSTFVQFNINRPQRLIILLESRYPTRVTLSFRDFRLVSTYLISQFDDDNWGVLCHKGNSWVVRDVREK